jgi:hypothetical protein
MKGATMTSSTLLSRGALAAIFVAASLVVPTALAQSPDRGSSVKDPARANVYVPPSQDTAARQAERWLEAHPNTQDLPDAPKTANVYVPPSPDTATQQGVRWLEAHGTTQDYRSPDARETANVYVPPSSEATEQDLRWLEAHGTTQDYRSPDVRETANVYVPPAQGLPAPGSLAHPQGIARAASPAADGGAGPWAVIGLALGCAALLGGAGLALVHRARRARRAVV